ncbi:hypothetical protein D3C79_799980 [compost metagenome]
MVVGRPKVSAAALTPRHGIVAFSGRWPGHPERVSCCARHGLRRTSTGHKGQLATLLLIDLHQSDVLGSAYDYPLSLDECRKGRLHTRLMPGGLVDG